MTSIAHLGWPGRLRYNALMNRHQPIGSNGEARLRYLDSDYQVVVPGSFVICAVTGRRVPLSELRYWSVDRQEAYADAAASLEGDKRAGAWPVQ